MRGLARAEWIRLRHRRANLVIALAIPLLAAFFFLAGYQSVAVVPPFDEQAYRQQIIDEGGLQGVPPDQLEAILSQMVESERVTVDQQVAQADQARSTYAFPQSLLKVLGNSGFVFFALILLTATTIGDDFSWGTIRTSLLASSDRRRLLAVRLGALVSTAAVLLTSLVLLGTLLPALLTILGEPPPAPPGLDAAGFAVLVASDLLVSVAVVGFAALATLLVRSGSLTLVLALVYVAVETATLALLLRFPALQAGGGLEWTLNLFPVRAIVSLLDTANRAAGAIPFNPGEVVVRDLGAARLPFATVLVLAAVFTSLAFRRFGRMDIVE
jgi:hypothetical protein